MRKLKIFLVTLICMLSSNVAFTLGVGDVEVKSALNDPLEAEIKLYSVQPGEGDNIRVNMATLKEFNAAGIERPLVLSYLKFKVVEKDGNAYIRVYSTRPIREPFLDFLVEIDWPSGRLLREYTLLLDPPVFAQRKAAPVQAATVAPAPAVVRDEPAPVVKESAAAPAPTAAPVTTSSDDGLFPRIQIDEPAPALDSDPGIQVSSFSGDSYKVKKNDTLWSIAESIRPDSSIGVSQMMLALQRANPEAFANNNINGLRSGFVLRIPDRAAINAISHEDAIKQAREQNEIWRSAQDNLTTATTPSGTTTQASGSRTAAVASGQAEPTVKLVTPDGSGHGAQGGGDDTASTAELALANEQLASREKENKVLQERVKSLEDQIGSMERLLELKENSLADLQDKLTTQPAEVAPAAEPVAEVKPDAESAPAPKVEEKKPVDVASNDINPFALPKDEQKPKALPKPAPKPAPAPRPAAEPSLFDDPLLLGGGVAVAVLLLALLWVAIQRRRANTMQFPESILTRKPEPATTTTSRTAMENETNLLSDFAPSSMEGAIETDSGEVDPLSEANVYLAYGKHQQAEDLLLDAISSEPERLDLKLKLMEVYHATGNTDAFLMHAQEMHDSMDGQSSALWDKACEMGRELLPGNELFGKATTGIEDDFSDLEGIADLDEDLDISFDEPEAETDASAGLSLEPAEEEVSAGEMSLDMDMVEETPAEKQNDDMSLDMDLGELSIDMAEEPGETATEEDTGMELDMGDLDIEGLDEDLSVSTDEITETEFDLGDAMELDVDDTLASADMDAEAGAEDEEMLGMDEVATKLDLAKAYIDMGDPDGARSILDEVMVEGNDNQQAEAKQLIDQL